MNPDAYHLLNQRRDQPVDAWEAAKQTPGLSERAAQHITIAIEARKRLEAAGAYKS